MLFPKNLPTSFPSYWHYPRHHQLSPGPPSKAFNLPLPTPHSPISTIHAGTRGIFFSDCIIALPKTHWWLAITFGMNSQIPNRVDRILRWCIWSPFRHAFHPALQVTTLLSHVLGVIFALLTLRLQASAKTSCVQVHVPTFQINVLLLLFSPLVMSNFL